MRTIVYSFIYKPLFLAIINYLDLVRAKICPFEANPILIVDPDAVLSSAVTG